MCNNSKVCNCILPLTKEDFNNQWTYKLPINSTTATFDDEIHHFIEARDGLRIFCTTCGRVVKFE